MSIIASVVLPFAVRKIVERLVGNIRADEIEVALASDPKAVNALNAEPLHQSRIVWGGTGGVVVAIAAIINQVAVNDFPNYDWGVVGPAIGTLATSSYVLYGRISTNLKPLFNGRR